MPGNDAAGLDRQLAEPKLAVLEMSRLLFEVDRSKRDIGNADRLEVDLLAGVGLHLIGRAFAGEAGRCHGGRSGDHAGESEALPERA